MLSFSGLRWTYLCVILTPLTHLFYCNSDIWATAAASICRGILRCQKHQQHKLWFAQLSRQNHLTSPYNPQTLHPVLLVSSMNTAEWTFCWCVHTWAQLHQVWQLLRRQGATAVFPHSFVIHFSSLPSLIVRRSLLQLKHQCSWQTAQ